VHLYQYVYALEKNYIIKIYILLPENILYELIHKHKLTYKSFLYSRAQLSNWKLAYGGNPDINVNLLHVEIQNDFQI